MCMDTQVTHVHALCGAMNGWCSHCLSGDWPAHCQLCEEVMRHVVCLSMCQLCASYLSLTPSYVTMVFILVMSPASFPHGRSQSKCHGSHCLDRGMPLTCRDAGIGSLSLTQTKPVHKYMISPKAVLTMQLAAFKAKMQLRHLLLHVPELAVRLTSSDSGAAPCSRPLPPGGSCRPLFLGYRENTMDT